MVPVQDMGQYAAQLGAQQLQAQQAAMQAQAAAYMRQDSTGRAPVSPRGAQQYMRQMSGQMSVQDLSPAMTRSGSGSGTIPSPQMSGGYYPQPGQVQRTASAQERYFASQQYAAQQGVPQQYGQQGVPQLLRTGSGTSGGMAMLQAGSPRHTLQVIDPGLRGYHSSVALMARC